MRDASAWSVQAEIKMALDQSGLVEPQLKAQHVLSATFRVTPQVDRPVSFPGLPDNRALIENGPRART